MKNPSVARDSGLIKIGDQLQMINNLIVQTVEDAATFLRMVLISYSFINV